MFLLVAPMFFFFSVFSHKVQSSIVDPYPGSGIGFFPDPGSPNPYFWELSDNFWGKKFYNSLKIGLNFFLDNSKTK